MNGSAAAGSAQLRKRRDCSSLPLRMRHDPYAPIRNISTAQPIIARHVQYATPTIGAYSPFPYLARYSRLRSLTPLISPRG
jgi:hypothetical protein